MESALHHQSLPQKALRATENLHDDGTSLGFNQQSIITATLDISTFTEIKSHAAWPSVTDHHVPATHYEQQPISYKSQPLPLLDAPNTRTRTKTFGQIYYGGCHFGQISLENGIPRFSEEGQRWILSRTGEHISDQAFQRSTLPGITVTSSPNYSAGLLQLPSRAITELVLAVYLNSDFRFPFPLIDGPLFKDTIALAYQSFTDPTSLEHICARCSVLAFLSIVDLFREEIDEFPGVDAEACAVEARRLLTDVLQDTNIMNVQTLLMLQIYETSMGRLPTAVTMNGVACRMIMTLDGHIDIAAISDHHTEPSKEERGRRHLRALFWVCYIFDKEIALRSSQPPFLMESYCDLTPPGDGMTHLSPNGPDEKLFSYFHGDIELSHLKGKANHLLYSAQASRKSDAELLRDIRELDSELEEWRLSLPANVRPSLSISRMSPPSLHQTRLSQRMRVILIHLEYLYLMIAIHHASGRCTTLDPQGEHMEGSSASVLDTSLALCLEASRSTIVYLKAMVSGLAGDTFWVMQFYPTVAIITLFLNILMNPLDNQADLDLELLSSAAEIFRFMPMYQHTPRNIDQVQMLENFVVELTRLGRCAVHNKHMELGNG
ncbi:hypothetical protein NM208_g3410 [Fusarium decemcellulare]|uniref:Uncharacterized protein n=1 Tax=Fusarium decemcellulare TaxID=57161 RepID=A0ACC1SP53_9HYPO|nr:hypothetical protein NM208_g3410 [Fusarium decemcellulare]